MGCKTSRHLVGFTFDRGVSDEEVLSFPASVVREWLV